MTTLKAGVLMKAHVATAASEHFCDIIDDSWSDVIFVFRKYYRPMIVEY